MIQLRRSFALLFFQLACTIFHACAPAGTTDRELRTIQVSPPLVSLARGTSATLAATGLYDDGSVSDVTTSVVWTSSDPSIASVSSGIVHGDSVGSVMIGVLDPRSGVSASIPLTVTPAVLTALEVTPSAPSIAAGTSLQLTATGVFSDQTTQDLTGAVLWTSSDFAASVANGGLASGVTMGSATLTAQDPRTGIQGATSLTVTPAVLTALAVDPAVPEIALGTTQLFTATGTFSDATTQDLTAAVIWSSSNDAVATVGDAPGTFGLATSVAIGATTVTAQDFATGLSGSTALTVTDAALVSIEVTPPSSGAALGRTQQLAATGHYTDASTQDLTSAVTWTSSDPAIAAVGNASGSEGLVTSLATGTVTVTALHVASGIAGSAGFDATPAVLVGLDVAPDAPAIALGTQEGFTATGTFSDGTTADLTASVTWSSTDHAVAVVSNALGSDGLATSIGIGSTTVGAVDPATGTSDSTGLTVTPAVLVSITLSPLDPSVPLGTTQSFAALGTYSDQTTQDLTASVTWSTQDHSLAVVSNALGSEGLLASLSQGTTIVEAVDAASGITGSTSVTVAGPVLTSLALSPVDPTITAGSSLGFTATGTFSDGSSQDATAWLSWSTSDALVCTVLAGLADGMAPGTVTITALDPGTGVLAATSVTVAPPPVATGLALTPLDPSITVGSSVQFLAILSFSDGTTQDVTGSASWGSNDTNIADVSSGLASGYATGGVTISADDPQSGFGAATTLTVLPAPYLTSIDLSPQDPTIDVGGSIQFTATGNYSDGSTQDLTGSVWWSSSDTNVAGVGGGLASAYNAGWTSVSVHDPASGLGASTNLWVSNPVYLTGIDLSPQDPTINAGDSMQFTVTANYSDGSSQDLTGSVWWTSSDTNVAGVSGGFVYGYYPGWTSISVYDPASGLGASTNLWVSSPAYLTGIDLSPQDPTIGAGGSIQFTATGNYSDGSTQDLTGSVWWSSSDTNVADVINGYAYGSNAGWTSISVYDPASGLSSSTSLSVSNPAYLTALDLSPADPTIYTGDTIQFSATGTYSDGSTQDLTGSVSWSSSSTWVADVSGGSASAYSVGWTTISIYDPSSGASTSTTLTVSSPPYLVSIDLSPADPTVTVGDTLQFTASGNYSDGSTQDLTGSVGWSSSDVSVADVSGGFAATYLAGTTTISIYDSGSGAGASTTLTVVP